MSMPLCQCQEKIVNVAKIAISPLRRNTVEKQHILTTREAAWYIIQVVAVCLSVCL